MAIAGLAAYEKYPNSWRLDHPDFPDVRATTFAKGVITDVQTLQDDPIAPTSLVKVDLGGDWVPLFYTPKKSFWDICLDWITLQKSQDFDEEGQFYKTAWISFRPGDEVVVMLRQGVPAAVIGFADGKPRVGENIIKFVCEGLDQVPSSQTFYKAAFGLGLYEGPGSPYDGEDTGPDGFDLGLTEEYPMITGGTTSSPTVTYWRLVGSWCPIAGYNPQQNQGDYAGGAFLFGAGPPYNSAPPGIGWWLDFYTKGKAQVNTTQVSMGPIPVGPVDFLLNGSYQLPGSDAEVDQEIYYYLMTPGGSGAAYPVYPNFSPDPNYPQGGPPGIGPGWNSRIDQPPPTSVPPGFAGGSYFNPVFDTDPLSWPVVNGTYGLVGTIPASAFPDLTSDYTFDYDYIDPVLGPMVLACTIGYLYLPPVNPTGPFDIVPVFNSMTAAIRGKAPVLQSGPFFSTPGPLLPSVGSIKALVRPHNPSPS